jgi:hypothetical protein
MKFHLQKCLKARGVYILKTFCKYICKAFPIYFQTFQIPCLIHTLYPTRTNYSKYEIFYCRNRRKGTLYSTHITVVTLNKAICLITTTGFTV